MSPQVTCHYSEPCTFRVNASDFVMDSLGRDGAVDATACPVGSSVPCLTTDSVTIEPAYGREQFTTSELKKFPTNGVCEGVGRVSCVFVLKTEDIPTDNQNVFEQTAIGKVRARFLKERGFLRTRGGA